jgi:hypothetical protein
MSVTHFLAFHNNTVLVYFMPQATVISRRFGKIAKR